MTLGLFWPFIAQYTKEDTTNAAVCIDRHLFISGYNWTRPEREGKNEKILTNMRHIGIREGEGNRDSEKLNCWTITFD